MAVFDNFYYAYKSSKKNGVPFSKIEMKGDWDWVIKASGTTNTVRDAPEERKAIKLKDIDITTKKSGALTLTVAENYQARFKIVTQNHKYFSDNMKTTPAKNQVNIQPAGLGYDEKMELILFGGDYISIDVDEEHTGIYRFRVQLNDQFYNIEDPDKVDDEVWVELIEARLIEGTAEEEEIDDDNFIDDEDGGEIVTEDDLFDEGELEEEEEEEEEEKKESNGMSWKGVLIIGAVVVGIVLLLRFARNSKASDSSSSTKSPSDGGSSGE